MLIDELEGLLANEHLILLRRSWHLGHERPQLQSIKHLQVSACSQAVSHENQISTTNVHIARSLRPVFGDCGFTSFLSICRHVHQLSHAGLVSSPDCIYHGLQHMGLTAVLAVPELISCRAYPPLRIPLLTGRKRAQGMLIAFSYSWCHHLPAKSNMLNRRQAPELLGPRAHLGESFSIHYAENFGMTRLISQHAHTQRSSDFVTKTHLRES